MVFDLIDADSNGALARSELLESPAFLALLRAAGGELPHNESDEKLVDEFLVAADVDVPEVLIFISGP